MPRRRVPEAIKVLRRRLRNLRGGDLDRVAALAGVRRSTVYLVRSGATRTPHAATLEALTLALNTRHPQRRRAATTTPEVESTMSTRLSIDLNVRCHRCAKPFEVVTYPDEFDEANYTVPDGANASCPWCGYAHAAGVELPRVFYGPAEDAERFAPSVFALCDRFEADTLSTVVDLDAQSYRAVKALMAGEPLEVVLAPVNGEHPGVEPVRAELAALHGQTRGGTRDKRTVARDTL